MVVLFNREQNVYIRDRQCLRTPNRSGHLPVDTHASIRRFNIGSESIALVKRRGNIYLSDDKQSN